MRSAGPWPGWVTTTRCAVGEPAAQVGDRALDVAAVAVDRDGGEGAAGRLRRSSSSRPNGLTVHHGMPELARVGAYVVELAVRRGAEVDRGGAAAGRGGPRRTEELLAGGDQVVRPAAHPLGVDDQHLGVGGHHVDQQLELVDEHRRQRLHPLDRDAGRDLGRSSRPAAGGPRPARRRAGVRRRSAAARGTAAPRAGRPARWCAGRRPRTTGSPRPRRPRTPPGSGAARSAGRRRPGRRGPRTRRASRPGRPGCTPRPRAGVRRRRARRCRPASAPPARGRRARPPAAGGSTAPERPPPGADRWSSSAPG